MSDEQVSGIGLLYNILMQTTQFVSQSEHSICGVFQSCKQLMRVHGALSNRFDEEYTNEFDSIKQRSIDFSKYYAKHMISHQSKYNVLRWDLELKYQDLLALHPEYTDNQMFMGNYRKHREVNDPEMRCPPICVLFGVAYESLRPQEKENQFEVKIQMRYLSCPLDPLELNSYTPFFRLQNPPKTHAKLTKMVNKKLTSVNANYLDEAELVVNDWLDCLWRLYDRFRLLIPESTVVYDYDTYNTKKIKREEEEK